LATGLSSGIAAFSAFPISISFAWLASYNRISDVSNEDVEQTETAVQYLIATALCALSLTANLAPTILKSCSKYSFFNRNNATLVITPHVIPNEAGDLSLSTL